MDIAIQKLSWYIGQNGNERENNGDRVFQRRGQELQASDPRPVWFARELRRNGRRLAPLQAGGMLVPQKGAALGRENGWYRGAFRPIGLGGGFFYFGNTEVWRQ